MCRRVLRAHIQHHLLRRGHCAARRVSRRGRCRCCSRCHRQLVLLTLRSSDRCSIDIPRLGNPSAADVLPSRLASEFASGLGAHRTGCQKDQNSRARASLPSATPSSPTPPHYHLPPASPSIAIAPADPATTSDNSPQIAAQSESGPTSLYPTKTRTGAKAHSQDTRKRAASAPVALLP